MITRGREEVGVDIERVRTSPIFCNYHEACMFVAHADDRDEALAEAMVVIRRLLEGLRADPAVSEA